MIYTIEVVELEEKTEMQDLRKSFIENIDSKTNVKLDYEKQVVSYDWLEPFEETVRYIDNILRNPKRFIINEEEIVKIEQSKKITVESVIHLTQHTNLIQDINEQGDVRPSKILNINKEESLDTYENRFIYTLIKNMNYFLDMHLGNTEVVKNSYCRDEKLINYNASVKINDENIKMSLNMTSDKNSVDKIPDKGGLSLEERIKKLKMQISAFNESELVKTLNKLHVPVVRPPIRKTNVILKNPNFQKAEQLWNYINSYEKKENDFIKEKKEYVDTGYIKNQFDQAFLLDYLALNSLSKNKNSKIVSDNHAVSMTVGKIIETLLDSNEDMKETEFKKIVNQEFIKARKRIVARDEAICDILNSHMKRANKQFLLVINSL